MKVYLKEDGDCIENFDYSKEKILFEKDLEIWDIFSYRNNYYISCYINREMNILIVEKIDFNENVDNIHCNDDIKCPYCKTEYGESWELRLDSGEIICEVCNSIFEYQRQIEVTYDMTPIKANDKIIKIED